MPQVFSIGNFKIYFWTNEGNPKEPVHVHVSEGVPIANAFQIFSKWKEYFGELSFYC